MSPRVTIGIAFNRWGVTYQSDRPNCRKSQSSMCNILSIIATAIKHPISEKSTIMVKVVWLIW